MALVLCDYCQVEAIKVRGGDIYPLHKETFNRVYWVCILCGAYVGTHKGTLTPLGRLANKELRGARMAAHNIFDPLWKSGKMTRTEAYAWLSDKLGLPEESCHIGMFDVEMCKRAGVCCAFGFPGTPYVVG